MGLKSKIRNRSCETDPDALLEPVMFSGERIRFGLVFVFDATQILSCFEAAQMC